MKCPKCGSKTGVIHTPISCEYVIRSRRCKHCGYEFRTLEEIYDNRSAMDQMSENAKMIRDFMNKEDNQPKLNLTVRGRKIL